MADDDKAKAGDDPWAGLESDDLPEATEGLSFSFDETPPSPAGAPIDDDDVTAAVPSDAPSEAATEDDDGFNDWVEEPESKSDEDGSSPELSVFQSDDDETDEENPSSGMIGQSSLDIGTSDSGIPEASALGSLVSSESMEPVDPFGGIGASTVDSAVPDPEAAADPEESLADEAEEISAEATDDASDSTESPFEFTAAESGDAGADDAPEADDDESPFSFASLENAGEASDAVSEEAEADDASPFSFASLENAGETSDAASAEAEENEDAPFSFEDAVGGMMSAEASEDDPAPITGAATGAADPSEPKSSGKKASRPAPQKKKKPSMVGQMIGVVVGGAMSIPIVIGILWWAAGKDTFKVAPMMPDALSFLVPAKFRSGGQAASTSGSGSAPSLDDVLGPDAGGGDVAMTDPPVEPGSDPVVPDREPFEPSGTDLASVTPVPTGTGEEETDPLMDLLNEAEPSSPVEPSGPPPAPEPVPLDTASLDAAAETAIAALDAVQSVDDPSDPVMKKLLVECYKSLSGYAQELAMLERVAGDTGRPLETMPAAVASVDQALASRPELVGSLTRLTRDWMNYSRRSSDGVVAPVTFQSARPVGPYWRAEVMLGEKPLVVLTRSEPAVAAGDTVIVTGLTVDGDVVWATQVRPAKAADPLFGP